MGKNDNQNVVVGTSYQIIQGSGRENHYAIFAGTKMIGDTSGAKRMVTPLEACEYLSDEALKRRGLDKVVIMARADEVKRGILKLKEGKSQAITAEEKEGYEKKIRTLQESYDEEQKKRSIELNIGLITALSIKEYLGSTGIKMTEGFVPYSPSTLERFKEFTMKPIN
jgi:hypothetical protein